MFRVFRLLSDGTTETGIYTKRNFFKENKTFLSQTNGIIKVATKFEMETFTFPAAKKMYLTN